MAQIQIKINKIFFASLVATIAIFSFVSSANASLITPERVVELANVERVTQNLPKLVINSALVKAAQDKLNDMLKNNYFEHTSPAGLTPWHWLEKNNYKYNYAGENLAMNFLSAENQNRAWMNSQTHRDNILNSHYQEIGVAVGQGEINGRETIVAVQEFGARADFVPIEAKKIENQPETDSTSLPQELPAKPQVLNDGKPRVLADNPLPAPVKFLEKIAQGNYGFYAMALALAGVGYATIFNFMILVFIAIESKRKNLQTEKYQVLYTVSAEEYEDLVRSFKARAKGTYRTHFDKIHLKMTA